MEFLEKDAWPCFLLAADGTVTWSNPAAQALQQSLAQATAHALLPDNWQQLASSSDRQQRSIDGIEKQVADKTLSWSFIPGASSGSVLARAQDVSELADQLSEARQASRLYRLIIDNTTDMISRHAPDGRFIDASPASGLLLGLWPEELRNRHVEEVLDFTDSSISLAGLRQNLLETGYCTFTLPLNPGQTNTRWLEIASRAIREIYTGDIIEVVSVARDITERVIRESEHRRHQEALAQHARLATLGELTSGIAHEINQPLASITNYANACLRYLPDSHAPGPQARLQEGLEAITSHTARAAAVIQRLRAFLKRNVRSDEPCELERIVGNAMGLSQWQAQQHGVRLRSELCGRNQQVRGDAILLEQVLINLIRNAIEANTQAVHDPSEVLIRTRLEADYACIEVIDQGEGADESTLSQMFDPFFSKKTDGLGIGLSMSRSIIDGFGGTLGAHNLTGGGLCAYCRLPLLTGAGIKEDNHEH
ncbi:MAG: PAS domain S-box protein [Halomonadaceae bacterium]|nr:MAG: PAS domain S-box protein [Halomonadaceae bacterium]